VRCISFSQKNSKFLLPSTTYYNNLAIVKNNGHHNIGDFEFSADDKLLITAEAGNLGANMKIWDMKGNLKKLIRGHQDVRKILYLKKSKRIMIDTLFRKNKVIFNKKFKVVEKMDIDGKLIAISPAEKYFAINQRGYGSYHYDDISETNLNIYNIKTKDIENKLRIKMKRSLFRGVIRISPNWKYFLTKSYIYKQKKYYFDIWDMAGNLKKSVMVSRKPIKIKFFPNGEQFLVDTDKEISIYDKKGSKIKVFKKGGNLALGDITADGKAIAVWYKNSNKVEILNNHGKKINDFLIPKVDERNSRYSISEIKFSNNGKKLAIKLNYLHIRLYSINGKLLSVISLKTRNLGASFIVKNGDKLIISASPGFYIWDLKKRGGIKIIDLKKMPPFGNMKFYRSDKGKIFIIWGDYYLVIVNLETDKLLFKKFHFPLNNIGSVALSNDNQLIVVSLSSDELKLINTKGKLIKTIRSVYHEVGSRKTGRITGLFFSPQNNNFVTIYESSKSKYDDEIDDEITIRNEEGKVIKNIKGQLISFKNKTKYLYFNYHGNTQVRNYNGKLIKTIKGKIPKKRKEATGLLMKSETKLVLIDYHQKHDYVLKIYAISNKIVKEEEIDNSGMRISGSHKNKFVTYRSVLVDLIDDYLIARKDQLGNVILWNLKGDILAKLGTNYNRDKDNLIQHKYYFDDYEIFSATYNYDELIRRSFNMIGYPTSYDNKFLIYPDRHEPDKLIFRSFNTEKFLILHSFYSQDWLVHDNKGYFDCSKGAKKYIKFKNGNRKKNFKKGLLQKYIKKILKNNAGRLIMKFIYFKYYTNLTIFLFATILIANNCNSIRSKSKNKELALASHQNNFERMSELLEFPAPENVNQVYISANHYPYAEYPLIAASRNGKIAIVERLLELGADVNHSTSYKGSTALYAASHSGFAKMVKLDSPLTITAKKKFNKIMRRLLKAGAKANKLCGGSFPLTFAASWNWGGDNEQKQIESVKILLNAGANPNIANNKVNTHTALYDVKNPKIMKILIKAGADANAGWRKGNTPLLYLIKSHHKNVPDLVEILIKAGAKVEIIDKTGYTPLPISAIFITSNRKAKDLIFEAGLSRPRATWHGSFGLLRAATDQGRIDIIKKLIKKKVNLNTGSKNGFNVLMGVAGYWKTEIAETMIKGGANINAAIKYNSPMALKGQTPLMIAIIGSAGYHQHLEFRRHLPTIGAYIEQSRKKRIKFVKMLIRLKANVNVKDSKKYTPLLRAAINGDYEIIKLLIKAGAKVNTKNMYDETALKIAKEINYKKNLKEQRKL